jgi:LPXTG-motif cell wall-anchored protein
VINRAGATGLRDEFQNALPAPRQAEVPIRILAGPSEAQPTATAKPKPRPQQPTPTPETPTAEVLTPTTSTITVTAELTATVGVQTDSTPTPTTLPAILPRTGTGGPNSAWLIAALALILGGALALIYRRVLL